MRSRQLNTLIDVSQAAQVASAGNAQYGGKIDSCARVHAPLKGDTLRPSAQAMLCC